MDILYVTSEAAPFCKTGGLADVLGSLPPAVAAGGDRAAVILPLYGQVSDAWREKMRWHGYTYVDLAWRHEYCGLFSLEYRGVVWYFLDNERYFRRGALYGQMDDGERFAFFSKAVVSVLPMLEWRPEVIHCNDWQTALVPIYLKTVAENVSTVFTIHNIEYQGKYGACITAVSAGGYLPPPWRPRPPTACPMPSPPRRCWRLCWWDGSPP